VAGSPLDSRVRRLFSTFASGAPGAGLLLIRVAAGISLLAQAVENLTAGTGGVVAVLWVLIGGIGMLLLVGVWTPVSGALAALDAAWHAFSSPGDVGFYILLGALATALMLLGPGAWSIDARLYGWKRIEFPDKN
jgi:putative oxidoreductase